MKFKIEKNIPLPERYVNGSSKYPFKSMKPGDSFLFPYKLKKKVSVSAIYYGRKQKMKFCVRDNRCWRVK